MKMRTEEELTACSGGGTQGSKSCGIRIQWSVITKDATIILLSPPCHIDFSCWKRGVDSAQTRPECGRRMALFLPLILILLLFVLSFSSIVIGPFEMMKMMA
jgi:hypothetical protein